MKTAIILHGMPSKTEYYDQNSPTSSGSHWIPWLQKQLIIHDILTQTPELPEPYAPDYEHWKNVFNQFNVDENTILIGHSCGAGFLVRWLSETKARVGKVILVAPWIDPTKELLNGFFDFVIDPRLTQRTDGITILISEDDGQEMLDSVDILAGTISEIRVVELKAQGHFTFSSMGTVEFPELLQIVMNDN